MTTENEDLSNEVFDHNERGFILREWIRDLVPVITMIIAGLIWGMKLEARYDTLDIRLLEMQKQMFRIEASHVEILIKLDRGILPRTEEKFNRVDDQISEMRRQIYELDRTHRNNVRSE
jgi:PIN domain nuclease of toxin-antitoxin system